MLTKSAAAAAVVCLTLVGVGCTTATTSASNPPPTAASIAPSLSPSVARSLHPHCAPGNSPRVVSAQRRSLKAVQFVSVTTGWAAGGSRVLATRDGGSSWTTQRKAIGARYEQIDAINATHVWIVGAHRVIRTNDGGRTWHQLPMQCPVATTVHFYSSHRGVAIAGGRLLKTVDGGRHWRVTLAPARAYSVCFSGARRGWLGARGRVYRTVDGGRRWAKVAPNGRLPKLAGRQPFAIVQCAGSHAAWAELVGQGGAASQQPHVAYRLSDSGSRPIFAEHYFPQPWVTVKRESPGSYYAAFSAINASSAAFIDTCPACGPGKSMVEVAIRNGSSFDGDRRLRDLNGAYGAAFISPSEGWVVGDRDHYRHHGGYYHRTGTRWKIVHTSDGGRHWTTQYSQ